MEQDYDHNIIPWSLALEIDTAYKQRNIPW